MLRPVLEALAQAHEDGVVHRDIKPANMILTAAAGSEGKARRAHAVPMRLLDFGIAKIMQPDEAIGTGETSTSAAALQFTRAYAAPEQLAGKRTGPWTDVHAMGLVLTEMLTDQPAWRGEDPVDLLRQAVAIGRPTPRRAGVDVGAWEAVLARAMAVVPAERFAHAGDLLAALEADVPQAAGRCEEATENPALSVATQVTAITSTTAPSVSAAQPLAPLSPEPARWYARPRLRYAVPGALGTALLASVALVGARGASVTAQRRDEPITAAVTAPTDVPPPRQEARTLAAPLRVDPELGGASQPDAGVQSSSRDRAGGVRGGRRPFGGPARDGGAREAPVTSVAVTPSVAPERDPSPPSPRRLSETLPPP